jgi:hypothetical protein
MPKTIQPFGNGYIAKTPGTDAYYDTAFRQQRCDK